MALHTLATNANLIAVQFQPGIITDADLSVIIAGIVNPDDVTNLGIKTTLLMNNTVTATVGSASNIVTGMRVMAVGITPGTIVTAISGTTVTLSIAATVAATNNAIFLPAQTGWRPAFQRTGMLQFPGRSLADIPVKANDYIAIDPLSGAVVLLPPAAISLTGSIWTFT